MFNEVPPSSRSGFSRGVHDVMIAIFVLKNGEILDYSVIYQERLNSL